MGKRASVLYGKDPEQQEFRTSAKTIVPIPVIQMKSRHCSKNMMLGLSTADFLKRVESISFRKVQIRIHHKKTGGLIQSKQPDQRSSGGKL